MPVDAFGYESMTLDEVIEQLKLLSEAGFGKEPVWVPARGFYHPIKRVALTNMGRPAIEVHRG